MRLTAPLLRFASLTFVIGFAAALAPLSPTYAAQWMDVATISNTLGNNAGRLCVGGGKTDIGCPTNAPLLNSASGLLTIPTDLRVTGNLYVSGTQQFDGVTFSNGGISATGIVTATTFSGSGEGLSNIPAGAIVGLNLDRIVSASANVVVGSDGMIRLTTGGVSNTAYFDTAGRLIAPGISTTGIISATSLYLNSGGWTQYLEGTQQTFKSPNSFVAAIGTNESSLFSLSNAGFPRLTINSTGQVGISTTAPSTTLDVRGTLRIANGGEACDTPRIGAIKYESGAFYVCQTPVNGWEAIATTGDNSLADRITSNSQAGVIANSTGYISLTTGGVTGTVYFNPAGVLVNKGVSTTGPVSATSVYAGNIGTNRSVIFRDANGVLNANGGLIYNTSGTLAVGTGAPSWLVNGIWSEGYFATNTFFNLQNYSMESGVLWGSGEVGLYGNLNGANRYMRFAVNSTEAMRIASTTNIGIGTASPTTKLDVSGTLKIANGNETCSATTLGAIRYAGGQFYVCRTAGTWETLVAGSGGTVDTDRITSGTTNVVTNQAGNSISFTTNGTLRAAFDSTGRLNLDYSLLLDQGPGATDNLIYVGSHTPGPVDASFGFMVGGVGTSGSADAPYFLARGNNFTNIPNQRGSIYMYAGNPSTPTATEGSIQFATGAEVRRMIIDNLGNVGIGTTTTASTLLDVSGTLKIANSGEVCNTARAGAIRYTSSSTFDFCDGVSGWKSLQSIASSAATISTGVSGSLVFRDQTGALFATNSLVISATNGSVGIGAAAPAFYGNNALYSAGTIHADGSFNVTDGNKYSWGQATTYLDGTSSNPNQYIRMVTNGTEALRVVSTGLIGIGTSTPTTKLDVSGTLKMSDGGETCSAATLGAIRYNANQFYVCRNGTSWETLTASAATGGFSDRIISGTAGVYTNQTGSTISMSTAGIERVLINASGNVGINQAPNTGAMLAVSGTTSFIGRMGLVTPNNTYNTIAGSFAGATNTGNSSAMFGYYTGQTNSGANSSIFGSYAGQNNSGGNLAALGYAAAQSNTALNVTAVGNVAGQTNTGANATLVGNAAGQTNTGVNLTAFGSSAGYANTGTYVTALGSGAAYANAGGNVTAVGNNAGYSNTGTNLTALGASAAYYNTGLNNTAIGTNSLLNHTSGASNVAVGINSGIGVSGTNTFSGATLLGSYSGQALTSGSSNTLIGYNAGGGITSGANNLVIGADTTPYSNTGSYQLNIANALWGNIGSGTGNANLIGINVTTPTTALDISGTLKIAYGNETCSVSSTLGAIRYSGGAFWVCQSTANGWEAIGTTGANSLNDRITSGTTQMIVYQNTSATIATSGVQRVVVGTNGEVGIAQQPVANQTLSVSGTTAITGRLNLQTISGSNLIIGNNAATANTGQFITAIGLGAAQNNTANGLTAFGYGAAAGNTQVNVVAIGTNALGSNTGLQSAAIGYNAGQYNAGDFVMAMGNNAAQFNTGANLTAIGVGAASFNTGLNNIAIGTNSMGNHAAGNNNVAIGHNAGVGVSNTAAYGSSVMIGSYAGQSLSTGTSNTLLGYGAGATLTSGGSNIAIGSQITLPAATGSYQLNIGNAIWGNIGSGLGNANLIGINVSSPTANLEVSGTVSATRFVGDGSMLTNISASGIVGLSADRITSGTTSVIATSSTSVTINTNGTQRVIIGTNGEVGIGSQPVANVGLTVSGTGYFLGKVGIGVSSPTANLEVSGTTSATTVATPLLQLRGVSGTAGVSLSVQTAFALDDLTDVTVATPVSGSVLMYNSTTSQWENKPYTALTGLANTDRLTSGTLAVTANSSTSVVSLTTGGTTWGYFGSTASYLPQLSALQISATNISASLIEATRTSSTNISASLIQAVRTASTNISSSKIDISGTLKLADGGETCDATNLGAIKYLSGQFYICRTAGTWETLVAGVGGSVQTDRITSGTTSMITYNNTSATIATAGTERLIVGTSGNIGIAQQPVTSSIVAISGTTQIRGRLDLGALSTSGDYANIFIGSSAGLTNSGEDVTAIGYNAGKANSGNYSTLIGWSAGENNTGPSLLAFGDSAAQSNTGQNVTALGGLAGTINSGDNLVAVGFDTAKNNSGANVTAVGFRAAKGNIGNDVIAIGTEAANYNSGASYTIAIGRSAAYGNSGADIVAIGNNAAYGNSGNGLVAIGSEAGNVNTATNAIILGTRAGLVNTGANAIILGEETGFGNTGAHLIALGYGSARDNTGADVVAIGHNTANSNSGSNVIAIGGLAATNNTRDYTVAIGYNALNANTTGYANVALGAFSGGLVTTGSSNTLLGYNTGAGITTGSNNLIIGANLSPFSNTGSNQLNIANAIWGNIGSGIGNANLIGINVTSPTANLEVSGTISATAILINGAPLSMSTDRITSGTAAAFIDPSGTVTMRGLLDLGMLGDPSMLFIGNQAGVNNTQTDSLGIGWYAASDNTGYGLVAIGSEAGASNAGTDLTALGRTAGMNNTGDSVVALGYETAKNNTASYVTAVGVDAAWGNTGLNVSTFGYATGSSNTGESLSALGYRAAEYNIGDFASAMGYNALANNSGASDVIGIGQNAANSNGGSNVIALGQNSAYGNTADDVVSLGHDTAYQNSGAGLIAIGKEAANGNIGAEVIALGTNSSQANQGANAITIGQETGYGNLGEHLIAMGFGSARDNTGNDVVAIGHNTANANTGNYTVAIGSQAAHDNTGNSTVAIGYKAAISNQQDFTVAIGHQALGLNTSGAGNVALGAFALTVNTTGNANTALGTSAGYFATNVDASTFVGSAAGAQLTTGSSNTFIGYNAGSNLTSGSNNLSIGTSTGLFSNTGSNQLNIANAIFGDTGRSLAAKIGINVTSPTANLEVSGTVSATRFVGDGSLLTGIGGGTPDRIVSGTLAVTANSTTSVVSLSTAGTTWGYLGSLASYLPYINSTAVSSSLVSATNVSATVLQLTGVTGSAGVSLTAAGVTTLASLTDVNVGTPTSGTVLTYNGSTSKWEAQANTGGGASSDRIISGTTNIIASTSGTISFTTNGTQRMAIDSSGRVGIGQVPAAGHALAITGNVSIQTATSNSMYIGNGAGYFATGAYNSGLGINSLQNNARGFNTAVGANAGQGAAAGYSTMVGNDTGMYNDGNYVTAIGSAAARSNKASYVVAVGNNAGYVNQASGTTAIGYFANSALTTGLANTSVGYYANSSNVTGNYNTALGYGAGQGVAANSFSANTFLGSYAGNAITTGSSNTIVGANSGMTLTTGSNNILIGAGITPVSATGSNQLSIGNAIYGDIGSATGLANKIGINVVNPTANLEVSGTVSVTSLFVNGVAVSGGGGTTDRIVSGTTNVTANTSSSTISLTTVSTTWGYFGSLASYLPNFNSAAVSSTLVSATNVSATLLNATTISSSLVSATNVSATFIQLQSMAGSAGVSTTISSTGADNLGNHTATQDLNLATYNVIGAGIISATGNIKTTAALQAGNTDTTCSTTADYGKMRFDAATKRMFLCRP